MVLMIRKMTKNELKTSLKLVKTVFMEFEAPDYSEEGIQTFLNFIELDAIQKMLDEGILKCWVCIKDKKIVGVLASKNISHICMLFVDKAYHKRGIAKQLFDEFSQDVKRNSAKRLLTVNSSPYAVGFYHKMGFKNTDNELEKDGIRFVPMQMSI